MFPVITLTLSHLQQYMLLAVRSRARSYERLAPMLLTTPDKKVSSWQQTPCDENMMPSCRSFARNPSTIHAKLAVLTPLRQLLTPTLRKPNARRSVNDS